MQKNTAQNTNPELVLSSTVRSQTTGGHPPVSNPTVGQAPRELRDELRRVGVSRDGFPVFDRPTSHHHVTGELLAAIISRVSLARRDFAKERVTFDQVVGVSECVATTPSDTVVFAQREHRAGLTRFVMHRQPEPCRSAIAIFKRMRDRPGYLLVTAFVGEAAEPEPWDRNATPASRTFWSTHALVWGSCPVRDGSTSVELPRSAGVGAPS